VVINHDVGTYASEQLPLGEDLCDLEGPRGVHIGGYDWDTRPRLLRVAKNVRPSELDLGPTGSYVQNIIRVIEMYGRLTIMITSRRWCFASGGTGRP
jgi:hypothetical protein